MEGTGTLATAVVDGVASLEDGVWQIAGVLVTGDLLAAERALQQVLRAVGGAVASAVLAQRAPPALLRVRDRGLVLRVASSSSRASHIPHPCKKSAKLASEMCRSATC